jgi:hypothetical protein
MDRLIKGNKAICEPSLTCPHDEANRAVNFQFAIRKSLKLLDVPRSFRLFLLANFQQKLRHTPILRQTMQDFVQSKKSVVRI